MWNGDITGYDSHSEADQALVCLLCFWTNFDVAWIDRLFRQSALERDKWERADYRQLTIDKALATVKEGYTGSVSNVSEIGPLIDALIQWANERRWTGRTGLTDQAVYLAHLAIVRRTGKQVFTASCRELAEMTASHWTTVNRANKRLEKMAFIRRLPKSSANLTNEFEIIALAQALNTCQFHVTTTDCDKGMKIPETTQLLDKAMSQNLPIECSILKQESDIWRYRGLGKTGRDVYKTLLKNGPLNQTEIAEVTGRSKSTVSRKVRVLIEVGMIADDFGKYEALQVENEAAVARMLGTFGAMVKQKERHRQDREARRRKLDAGRLR